MARRSPERCVRHTPRSCCETLGYEPEIQTSERGFERQLDLALLALHCTTCRPTARSLSDTNRSVAHPNDQAALTVDGRYSLSSAPRFKSSVLRYETFARVEHAAARQTSICSPAASRGRAPTPVGSPRRRRVKETSDIGPRGRDPALAPRRGPRPAYAQEAIADRKPAFEAAFAKRVVAVLDQDPGGIGGGTQRPVHGFRRRHAAFRQSRPAASSPSATSSRLVTTRSACAPAAGPCRRGVRRRALSSVRRRRPRCLPARPPRRSSARRRRAARGGQQEDLRVRLAMPQVAAADVSGEDVKQAVA